MNHHKSYLGSPEFTHSSKLFYVFSLSAIFTDQCIFADLEDEEEMKVLEDEINELHKSNSQLENEMSQLKAQISNMENKMSQQERENQVLEDKTNDINDYLAYMRKSLVNCLQDVKLPDINETICEENFDTYIGQLRSLCMDNYTAENSALYNTVKQAMQGIEVN